MPKTLRFELEISDGEAEALEMARAYFMEKPFTGIKSESELSRVYAEVASVGLFVLIEDMARKGDYSRYKKEAVRSIAADGFSTQT